MPASASRSTATPRVSTEITPTAPFAFDLALDYLRGSPSAVVERVEGDAYLRAVPLNGRMSVLCVSSLGTADRPRLLVELLGDDPRPDDLPDAIALTRTIFTTDDDITPLYRTVEADPVFARLAWSVRGLRPVLIADPFEAIVWAIIGQQINISFAARMKRALVERFGAAVALEGLILPTFPSPERLAELDHERDLLPIQFSRQKSRYSIALARAVRDGDIDLTAVGQLPAEEAIATLTALPGIGRWTAEYALMRAFGHRDVMPAGDGGLKHIVGREYGYGRLATESEVRAHGEAWAGWRAYAAFYWWYQLQAERRRRSAGQSAVGSRG